MDRRRLTARGIAYAAFLALALPIAPAFAGLQNDVPSCYAANHITSANAAGYTRLIYVLVDQTVAWNKDLAQAMFDNLNTNLIPGTKFVIAEFSAFSQGRYLDVIHTGIIESPMQPEQIGNTPIEKTKLFNACLADQRPFAIELADRSLRSALQNSSGSLNHSDIMSALQSVSGAIAADPASQKLLFLASDGLENSAAASFYKSGSLRDINPQLEIKRAITSGLLGNFGGTKVFVIGGALQNSNLGDYRSPAALTSLKTFWQSYFQKSDAELIEFGEPALLQPVGF